VISSNCSPQRINWIDRQSQPIDEVHCWKLHDRLLFAEDLGLLAPSEHGLQHALIGFLLFSAKQE